MDSAPEGAITRKKLQCVRDRSRTVETLGSIYDSPATRRYSRMAARYRPEHNDCEGNIGEAQRHNYSQGSLPLFPFPVIRAQHTAMKPIIPLIKISQQMILTINQKIDQRVSAITMYAVRGQDNRKSNATFKPKQILH